MATRREQEEEGRDGGPAKESTAGQSVWAAPLPWWLSDTLADQALRPPLEYVPLSACRKEWKLV